MQNFEKVVDIFRYLLEDEKTSTEYIKKLFYNTRVPLREEDIISKMSLDQAGNIMMIMSDLGLQETQVLFRDIES